MVTRRQFNTSAFVSSATLLAGCSPEPAENSYALVANQTWQLGALNGLQGAALGRELVRYATLAPSSHNTQCWKFALDGTGQAISIQPDLARLCPAVDPDLHHVFVSLGCAAENLTQAALAHGLKGDVVFDPAADAVRVALSPTAAQATDLFKAIPLRQNTRGEFDAKPLTQAELALLERAGSSDRVRLLLLTDKTAMAEIAAFNLAPHGYVDQLAAILAHPGQTPAELTATVSSLRAAWQAAVNLAGSLYKPMFNL